METEVDNWLSFLDDNHTDDALPEPPVTEEGALSVLKGVFEPFGEDNIALSPEQALQIDKFMHSNQGIPLCAEFCKLPLNELSDKERATFLGLLRYFLWNNDLSVPLDAFKKDKYVVQKMIELGMLENTMERISNEDEYLTVCVRPSLKKCGKLLVELGLFDLWLTKHLSKYVRVIKHQNIKQRNLFFPESIARSLIRLTKILSSDNYSKVCRLLEDGGHSPGIVELFYGPPGTGKTEVAFQIARLTGRDIYMAEISCLTNSHVGESEKAYTELFATYNDAVDVLPSTPILMLNEADAFMSKRITDVNGSADMGHNMVANIILQALENYRGILFATTNLAENFDKAFDRRITGKIEIPLPDASCRYMIWRENLKNVPDDWLLRLSSKYAFSGGEIRNASKTFIMDALIDPKAFSFEHLDEICESQNFRSKDCLSGFLVRGSSS